VSAGHWVNEWAYELLDAAFPFYARRAIRRPSRDESGSEDYLVSVTDTSTAARRKEAR
jgi:hypothetical protein